MSTGPAWSSWMTKIVPDDARVEFFSVRSSLSSFFVFVGLVTGGLVLHFYSRHEKILEAFFGIFILGGILRIMSSYFLSRHPETKHMTDEIESFSFKHTWKNIWKKEYSKIFKFIFIFQFGVYFSAAFFNPFMLKELKFSYRTYMIMLAASFVAKIIAQTFAKKIINKIGPQKTLLFSTLGIAPLPLVWTFSQNVIYLGFMQIASGFMWGTYELITFLILFNQIPQKERTEALTFFNFAQTLFIIVGSVMAGIVFKHSGTNYHSYMIVFYASSILRLLSLLQFPDLTHNISQIKNWVMLKPSGLRISRVDFSTSPVVVKSSQSKKDNDSKKNS
jgi:MFS family permease